MFLRNITSSACDIVVDATRIAHIFVNGEDKLNSNLEYEDNPPISWICHPRRSDERYQGRMNAPRWEWKKVAYHQASHVSKNDLTIRSSTRYPMPLFPHN